MLPVKVHTYIFDVTDLEPEWGFDHELTSLYKMNDLSPSSFDDLSNRILESESWAAEFLNNMQ
jgi:hypothetical protein